MKLQTLPYYKYLIAIALASFLLSGCSPMNELQKSVKTGDLESTEQLLKDGAEVGMMDPFHGTLLCIAARYDQAEMIDFLIKHGANVNAQNQHGYTAFHCARSPSVVSALVQNGGDPFIKSFDQVSALAFAVREGHYSTTKKFIELGLTDLSVGEGIEYSAIDYAISRCYLKTAYLVMEHKLATPIVPISVECKNNN